MTLQLGDTAPDFLQDSSLGPIQFHAWAGSAWVILFSHPADFTPVCTTELGWTGKLQQEFEVRNVKAIALSVDHQESHRLWISDIEKTQRARVAFPIIADHDRRVAHLYDMIHPQISTTATVRSLFVIDPAKKVRLTLTYPMSTGRNFDEVLRVVDALQLTDAYSVATPANWQPGEDVIIPLSVQGSEAIARLYPKGYTEILPYLRITPQPGGDARERAQLSVAGFLTSAS